MTADRVVGHRIGDDLIDQPLQIPAVGVLGVAWMRIASAALIFAPWTRPWRTFPNADPGARALLLGLGARLAIMNTSCYLALLPATAALIGAFVLTPPCAT